MEWDLMEIMCSIYKIQGIQILRFRDDYTSIAQIDYGFREKMFPGYDYLPGISHVFARMESSIIYQLEDDLKLYYISLHLPTDLELYYHFRTLIIGPILFQPMTTSTFRDLMKQKKIPLELHWEVQEFYNRIPVIPSYETWYNTLYFFLSKICGTSLELHPISSGEMELFRPSYEDYPTPTAPEVGQKTIEDRYKMEANMIQAVSIGDLGHALEFHNNFRQYKLLPRTPDPLRNEKNFLITLNTLLRKAAQTGGVHPLHIDNLSRQFAVQIELASTSSQLGGFPANMIRKYCMIVKNHSRKAYSSLVQTCMDYIDFHYMENLSLDVIAKMCSVSNSYLSALFKKEVKVTLTDYINSTRIRRSLTLLNTTNLSIQEIACQCGFSDSNYYTRTFKKFQGKSPKQYREEIRK